ncbi:PDZ domain-containing protein [Domibacillus enclensis]|uniref:PDZ domain-containing protein n=1 Tax=Domibacillus enclensis TaxID=1017273 RepID=A0A1N6SL41_9BACI|nr:PDZ domain-containing protein [Domibacillus enclensis]OXS79359.1 PDZ domain-containing protein [Domibacillus enclensis]SIQ41828.1 PDZ domain-containing protein [Domibacillus enclensis]
MALDWLMQLLAATGRLLLHPIFYFSFILAFIIGMFRVARERKDFDTRVYDIYQEIRFILPSSLAVGAIVSVTALGLGLALPADLLSFIAALFIIFSMGGFFLLSPAWTLSAAYIIFFFSEQLGYAFISFEPLQLHPILTILSVLTALLMIAEGVLIRKRGYQGTSPRTEVSKRGQRAAVHLARRLWLVPVFLPVPGSRPLESFADWWPVLPIGAENYYLVLFPFLIGFSMTVRSTLPALAVQSTGRSVTGAGIVALLLAAGSYWLWPLSAVSIAFAIMIRIAISRRHYSYEKHRPYFFTTQSKGIMIVGVLPATPARKMGLDIGEVITKVNDVPIQSEPEFYKALQKNAAYCRLEVIGNNGQLRFVQGSIYENEHHELGLLFAPEEKEYMDDSVFTD